MVAGAVGLMAANVLSLRLAIMQGGVSAVWPATGVAIWVLIRLGPRMWPLVAGSVLVAQIGFSDFTWQTLVWLAAGATLEALAGVWLWRAVRGRWSGAAGEAASCLAAALVAPLASATVGSAAVAAVTDLSMPWLWPIWWAGNAIGALAVLPVLLAGPELAGLIRTATGRETARAALVLAAAAGVSWLSFALAGGGAFLFAILPVLLLAMMWFGVPGVRLLALLIAAAAVAAELAGRAYSRTEVRMATC